MFRWQRIWVFSFLMLATTTFAQDIPVRSGAHDGFARLVVRTPNGTEWSLQPRNGGAALRMSGYDGSFDLSGVFDLIDRTFIQSVENTDGGFDIEFACDCTAQAFEVDGGFVVIDVAKTPAEAMAANLPSIDWPAPKTRLQLPGSAEIISFEEIPPLQESIERVPPSPSAPVQPREVTPLSQAREALADALPEPSDESVSVLPTQLAEAQRNLARRVAIAATRGILDPTSDTVSLPTSSPSPQIDVSIFNSSVAPQNTSRVAAANLRVTSSSDLPGQALIRDLESTSMGLQCPDENLVDVGAWGTELPPMQYISDLRAQLFSETDRLQREIAVDLARLYLHFSFGAEASQVLKIDADLAAEHPELIEIAEIMEFGNVNGDAFLSRFTDCSSAVSMWAVLAHDDLGPSATIDVNAALLAVTGLPMHLRRFIAPMLSRKFLQYGDEAAAATALRSLERAPDPLSAGAELARAELQMAEGNQDAAQETLAGVVASNEQQSAEALIQFVDSHLAADSLIDEDVATLVEAYAIEMREDPLGPELQRTHVLALAKSGQFDQAFAALDRFGRREDDPVRDDLRASLIGIATRNATDVVFLEHIFTHTRAQRKIGTPAITLAATQRLLELGFPHMASSLLSMQEELPNSARVKKLRAQLALDLGRPLEAEAMLFGLESDQAKRLLAEAEAQSSNFDTASVLFADVGDEDARVRNAFLAEDWDSLAAEGNSPLAGVASLIDVPVDDIGDTEGMLGRLNSSLSESARARDLIQSLLTLETTE